MLRASKDSALLSLTLNGPLLGLRARANGPAFHPVVEWERRTQNHRMSSEEWRGICFGPSRTSFGWRELRGCVICFVWFLLDRGIIEDQAEHRGLDCSLF